MTENNDNQEKNIYTFVIKKIMKNYEDSKDEPNFMNCFVIYSVLFILVLVTPFFLYNLANSDDPTNRNTMNNMVFYILFFIMLFFSIIFLDNQSKVLPNNRSINTIVAFSVVIFSTILIGCAMYFYNNESSFSKKYTMYADIALYVIVFLIIIVALALVYKIFINNLRKQTGIIGFIINFIFFIPCLFGDFVEYIKYQFKITPNAVFILFILEILLIIAFIYIPIWIEKIINKDKITLLPGSIFIDNSLIIGNSDNLAPFTAKNDIGNETKTPRFNYGLSMWVYLNQQTTQTIGTRLVNIFSYGENNNMKPQVSYFEKGKNDSNKNIYRITFTGSQESIDHDIALNNSYDVELTSQKWNHIFFNYHSTHVDLFINGILERTFDMNGTIPQYSILDKITVGENNGLDGAICNVTYYKTILTKFQITNLYNLLMNKNPPINNII